MKLIWSNVFVASVGNASICDAYVDVFADGEALFATIRETAGSELEALKQQGQRKLDWLYPCIHERTFFSAFAPWNVFDAQVWNGSISDISRKVLRP